MFEIKDNTERTRSASHLDLHIEIDSEGRVRTKLYDKREGFNFPIVNFPFQQHLHIEYANNVYLCLSANPELVHGSYRDFLDRGLLLTRKIYIYIEPMVPIGKV